MTTDPLYFLIPYKATEDDGADLRLTLRGVGTNLHLDREVVPVVAGERRPTWLDPEVWVQTENESFSLDRVRNVMRTVLSAIEQRGIQGEFVYLNDDFILLEPREDILRLHQGPWEIMRRMTSRWLRHPQMQWYGEATRETTRYIGLLPEPLNWETHQPMWFDADRLVPLLEKMVEDESPAFFRTVYGNLMGYGDRPIYRGSDGLVYGPSDVGSSWAAVNEKHTTKTMMSVIRSRVRVASRWEITK